MPRLGTRLLFSPLPEKLSRHAGRMLAQPPAQAALVKGTQDSHRTDAGSRVPFLHLSSPLPTPLPKFTSTHTHLQILGVLAQPLCPPSTPAQTHFSPRGSPPLRLTHLEVHCTHSALTLTLTSCSSLKLASEYTYTQQKTPLAPAPDASTPVAPVAGAHSLQLLPPQPGGVCAPSLPPGAGTEGHRPHPGFSRGWHSVLAACAHTGQRVHVHGEIIMF